MRKFVAPAGLCDFPHNDVFYRDAVQHLKCGILAPPRSSLLQATPSILLTLQSINFQLRPSKSLVVLNKDNDRVESRPLLMFWCGHGTFSVDSKATVSMDTDSLCSTSSLQTIVQDRCGRELRTTAQQTDISCPSSAVTGEINTTESEMPRSQTDRTSGPTIFAGRSNNILHHNGQISILGSMCALLLQKQTQQSGGKELSSCTGSMRGAGVAGVPDTICRICFGGESAEHLVRPCSCRGTIACVHRTCLERWLLQAATSYCELCRYHYDVTRTHKWTFMRSLAEWARSGRGRALAADLWRGAALGAASVLGTARALHACDRVLQAGARQGGSAALVANLASSLLIGVIGALNGLLTTWMLLKIQEHQVAWQSWRDSTLHVHVTLNTDALDPRDFLDTELASIANSESNAALAPVSSDSTVIADSNGEVEHSEVTDPSLASLAFRHH